MTTYCADMETGHLLFNKFEVDLFINYKIKLSMHT